jgi:hypothetical protein
VSGKFAKRGGGGLSICSRYILPAYIYQLNPLNGTKKYRRPNSQKSTSPVDCVGCQLGLPVCSILNVLRPVGPNLPSFFVVAPVVAPQVCCVEVFYDTLWYVVVRTNTLTDQPRCDIVG